jgi:hypothetical protein
MKILKTLAIAVMLGTAIVSCSKDSDTKTETQNTSIEGKYVGKYGFDNETPNEDFILNIKPGGVFQEIGTHSGNPTGQGTWQLNGNKLTATYKMLFSPFNEYKVSLTYDATAKKLSGTWGFDGSYTDGGKMEVKKQ